MSTARPARTQDERKVLHELLRGRGGAPGTLLTCGGCTESGEAWEALGLLMDICLDNRALRMRPGDFRQRLMWVPGRGDAFDILAAAWPVITQARGGTLTSNAKLRRGALAEWLAGGPFLTEEAFAAKAPQVYGEGVWRISRMLVGVHRATGGRGLGSRCRRVWRRCIEDLLRYAGGAGEHKWLWLAPLCTQILRADDSALYSRSTEFPAAGEPDVLLRLKVAECAGGGDRTARGMAPTPEGWLDIVRVVVPRMRRKDMLPDAFALADALEALVSVGGCIVEGLGQTVRVRKGLESDCRSLARSAAMGGRAAAGAQGVLALLRQAQQYECIRQAPASGRTRRRA